MERKKKVKMKTNIEIKKKKKERKEREKLLKNKNNMWYILFIIVSYPHDLNTSIILKINFYRMKIGHSNYSG